jgi:DNA-binding transcriptional LysR family regulator
MVDDRSQLTNNENVLNPQRLRVFQAVVAAGSLQAAARNLNYSPATVSQHITALGKETGLQLFERDGRGIRPTAAGLRLAEQADEALAGLNRLDRVVDDLRSHRSRHLAIACFSSVAKEWIPLVVLRARQLEPKLTAEISLNEPHGGQGRRPADVDVRNESLDEPAAALEGYERHELCVEDFAVAVPADHPLVAVHSVSMQQLEHEHWVDHDIYESPTGRIIRSACQAAGFTPEFRARLDDHHAALSLVAAGLGVTVLPHLALRELPQGVAVKPLHRPRVQRRIVAHVRRSTSQEPLVEDALHCLSQQAEHLMTAQQQWAPTSDARRSP